MITPDFSVSPQQLTLTIPSGQSGSTPITVTPATKLSSQVQFTLMQFNGYVVGMNCAVNPNPVSLSKKATATATFGCSVPPPSASTSTTVVFRNHWSDAKANDPWLTVSGTAFLFAFVFFLFPAQRNMRRLSFFSLTIALITFLGACGGGESGGGGGGGGGTQTPASVTLSVANTKVASNSTSTATINVTGTQPTGTVTLFDNTLNVPLGSASLVNGQAQLPLGFPGIGAHAVTAQYSGDAKNTFSQTKTPLTIVVTGTQPGLWIEASTGVDFKVINLALTVQ